MALIEIFLMFLVSVLDKNEKLCNAFERSKQDFHTIFILIYFFRCRTIELLVAKLLKNWFIKVNMTWLVLKMSLKLDQQLITATKYEEKTQGSI